MKAPFPDPIRRRSRPSRIDITAQGQPARGRKLEDFSHDARLSEVIERSLQAVVAGIVQRPYAAPGRELPESLYLQGTDVEFGIEEQEVERMLRNEVERAHLVQRHGKALDPPSGFLCEDGVDLQRVEVSDPDQSPAHGFRSVPPVRASLQNMAGFQGRAQRAQEVADLDLRGRSVGSAPKLRIGTVIRGVRPLRLAAHRVLQVSRHRTASSPISEGQNHLTGLTGSRVDEWPNSDVGRCFHIAGDHLSLSAPTVRGMWRNQLFPPGTRELSYHGAVAYDEQLADRIRELVSGEPNLTEKKMFGGLAFLISGNMAVAASGQGGVLVRVDPARSDRLVATTNARPMEMRGQPMKGWLRVDPEDVRTKRQLTKWVELGTTYARALLPKR
jgi:TfoX/Sxy family transcriptional regulator of competence genes